MHDRDTADGHTMASSAASAELRTASRIVRSFVLLSVLFSANHGCVVACLGLATAKLGSVGALQSGVLYATYTGSALAGSTWVVKTVGSRNAIVTGMALYCCYVTAFWLATVRSDAAGAAALAGALLGGVGAGFLWTAQGAYFAASAEEHAALLQQPTETSTAQFAGIFAFIYLASEVSLRSLSTVLLQIGNIPWVTIFGIYAAVALLSTVFMVFVPEQGRGRDGDIRSNAARTSSSSDDTWYKVTAAWQLLRRNPKMKHLIGLNAVFGFAAAFMNSYVNGEVVRRVLHDEKSKYVGLLTAWVSTTAAGCSLFFGRFTAATGRKGPILITGAVCFLLVALPFLVWPAAEQQQQWSWGLLLFVYTM
jgi:MFS family permease